MKTVMWVLFALVIMGGMIAKIGVKTLDWSEQTTLVIAIALALPGVKILGFMGFFIQQPSPNRTLARRMGIALLLGSLALMAVGCDAPETTEITLENGTVVTMLGKKPEGATAVVKATIICLENQTPRIIFRWNEADASKLAPCGDVKPMSFKTEVVKIK